MLSVPDPHKKRYPVEWPPLSLHVTRKTFQVCCWKSASFKCFPVTIRFGDVAENEKIMNVDAAKRNIDRIEKIFFIEKVLMVKKCDMKKVGIL